MIFLRFPDEQTFLVLTEPFKDAEGHLTIPNLDAFGEIYEGGEWDEEGNTITPPTQIPGYHVNMIGPVPEAFEAFVIERPNHPYRVFAGK